MKDVFDSGNYRTLQSRNVTLGAQQQTHKFFGDSRDIALGLSTDGFAPFKRRKKTAWPLVVFNYNLPPEMRFHIQYILCVGVIPGPNKPKDFDSFIWALVEEFLTLLVGVRAFDTTTGELFKLRAYLILVFGDMPAISMVMRMKGHNGLVPCRMCTIQALRTPGARGVAHYVPLDRSQHPDIINTNKIQIYDPDHLPLRTHDQFLEDANYVQFANNTAEEERRAKARGIKGIPLLSHLPSLFFPTSFPFDFMHLIYENVLKNLILLWTGNYKELDEGSELYELMPDIWEGIGVATAESGSTIPSTFGARPPNVEKDKTACTADSWSFWALYLGPVLLRGRFQKKAYYDHFISLVKLLHLSLQFDISKEDIMTIRTGFKEWVHEYER